MSSNDLFYLVNHFIQFLCIYIYTTLLCYFHFVFIHISNMIFSNAHTYPSTFYIYVYNNHPHLNTHRLEVYSLVNYTTKMYLGTFRGQNSFHPLFYLGFSHLE